MRDRRQVACTYRGLPRVVCPIVLGHSRSQEKALTYQVGGESSSGVPPDGEWRCLVLSEVENARLKTGPWRSGERHSQQQACVEEVDLDVNPDSPYEPRRVLDVTAFTPSRDAAEVVVSLFATGGGVMLPGPGAFSVVVVGASNYQPAIEAAASTRKKGARTVTMDAVLVLEDSNPYDSFAVQVQIAGKTVGYLKREVARRYRAVLEAAGYPRVVVRCKARIVGGFETRKGEPAHFGVRLDLPPFPEKS